MLIKTAFLPEGVRCLQLFWVFCVLNYICQRIKNLKDVVMQKNRFRFGLTSTGAGSADAWKEKVLKTEDLGFSTLLIPDHFIEQIATIPAMMSAAAYTSKLRVGSIVCNNDFRHPVLLSKEAATIDMLSGGRVELGLGAGWLKSEYDALGLSFDSPGTRIGRLEEAVQIIKAYFKDDPVKFEGKYYTINGEQGLEKIPEPVQKPHPPLLIGGGGKRILKLAAREADIIGIALKTSALGNGPDPQDIATTLQQKITWIRETAGDRFKEIELHMQTEQTRAMYGISYFSVFDHYIDAFAPIVARLADN
ncbi:MAG: TIGR03621 family F420-dependent LLM class oxidoreductase [Anaerolineales bacterium]